MGAAEPSTRKLGKRASSPPSTDPETHEDGLSTRRTGRRCGARIRGGRYCKLPAGYQTDHPGVSTCYRHGGNNQEQLTHVGMRLAHHGIMEPNTRAGDIVQLEPHNALIWAIWIGAGDVAFWNNELAQLDEDDPNFLYNAAKLFKEQRAANKEMRSAAKMALDAGLAERQVMMAERMAGLIADAVQRITGELSLTPQQEALLPDIVRRHLMTMEAPGDVVKMPRPKAALMHHKIEQVIDQR